MNTGHILGVINMTKTKIIVLKLWVRIQKYTAVDFEGWSKMTLEIKNGRTLTVKMNELFHPLISFPLGHIMLVLCFNCSDFRY